MAELLADNPIAKRLLSYLWLRLPFIISSKQKERADGLAVQLLDFVPEYRQLIACGTVPRSVEFSLKKPRIIDTQNLDILKESLFASFEEEKMGARPIQLVCFDSSEEVIKLLLCPLERGWFATTELNPLELNSIVEVKYSETIAESTIAFLRLNSDFRLEEMLLEKARNRPTEVAPFIFQLKMSEVNLVGNAILKEIENRVVLSQVEIQELFEIDEPTFHRTIELLLCESKTDVRPYILMTPEEIQQKLDSMIEIDSIYLSGVIENDKLIGLSKARDLKFSPGPLLTSLSRAFTEVKGYFNFGEPSAFAVELMGGKKILFVSRQPLIYCFFADATANIDLLLDKISGLL